MIYQHNEQDRFSFSQNNVVTLEISIIQLTKFYLSGHSHVRCFVSTLFNIKTFWY